MQIQSLFKALFIFTSFVLSTSSHAALDLELTQGLQGAIPIAIVPFAGQSDAQAPDNVSSVVSADLSHSGRFKVTSPNSLQQQPHDNQEVDYNYWQKKTDNLVVGKVSPLPDGRYQVNFSLLNTYAGKTDKQNESQQNPVLLSEQFTIDQAGLRRLAHHVSDLIYQKLTGDRGIFSTKIAYVLIERNGNQNPRYMLQVADVDGYNPKPLVISNEPIMSPAWAPNGRSIAYVSFEGDNAAIYVQDIATGKRRTVSSAPGINGAPAWSPDSKKLALVLTRTGYPKIYVLDLASGNLTQVTDGWSIDTEPSWSPNGKSLLFTSNRGGGPEIYQVAISGGQAQRLTYNSNYNARAAFTPDGNSIIMLTQDGNGFNIAQQDLTSGRVTLLTDSGLAQSPSVAPNGKMVVYANVYQGTGILGMSSTDGNVKLRIPSQEGDVQEPAWSPYLN